MKAEKQKERDAKREKKEAEEEARYVAKVKKWEEEQKRKEE